MLLFLDSFDHYASTNMLAKYDFTDNSSIAITTNGRTFNCYSPSSGFGGKSTVMRRNLRADVSEIITGFAYYVDSIPSSGAWPLVSFSNAGLWLGGLYLDSVGRLYYGFASGLTDDTANVRVTPYTPGGTIVPGVWNYIELDVKLAGDTSGSVILNVSGVQMYNTTAIQTTPATATLSAAGISAMTNQFSLRSAISTGAVNARFDDLYVFDTNNDADDLPINVSFAGDNKVAWMKPTADGFINQLNPSTGTDNSANVDDLVPDDDLTYNSSPTPGAKDLYVMSDLPPDVLTVHGIQVGMYARKDDASTRIIAAALYDGVHPVNLGANKSLPQNYGYLLQTYDSNPMELAGTAWSVAAVNNLQVGIEIIS